MDHILFAIQAREFIALDSNLSRLAILARSQSAGRGTRGRTWASLESNMYLTVAFRMTGLPIPLTLTPLRYLQCS